MEERSKMIAEILYLAQNPPLRDITAKTFADQDDHRVHGALMAMRAFDTHGRLLLGDIIGSQVVDQGEIAPHYLFVGLDNPVVDFSLVEIQRAFETWRG